MGKIDGQLEMSQIVILTIKSYKLNEALRAEILCVAFRVPLLFHKVCWLQEGICVKGRPWHEKLINRACGTREDLQVGIELCIVLIRQIANS